ncbi:MAG: hypothetical protein JSS96_14750 [Bacteroidetes bacterium]|nr:hypothetical protein [Bacteroidota bacterium]
MSLNRLAICILFPDVDPSHTAAAIEKHHVEMLAEEPFDIEKEYSTYFSEYDLPKHATPIHLLFIFSGEQDILADTEDHLAEALEHIINYKKTKASLS